MAPRSATKATSRSKAARKTPAMRSAPARRGSPRPSGARKRPAARSSPRRPSFSSPSDATAKAEGNLPVQAYIISLPSWKRDVARRFDAIVDREVRGVRKAIKWRAAFYGVPGMGWFASVKAFNRHVKVTFFRGTSLKPVPPAGTSKEGRSLDVREGEPFDEERMTRWVKQAAALPGWGS